METAAAVIAAAVAPVWYLRLLPWKWPAWALIPTAGVVVAVGMWALAWSLEQTSISVGMLYSYKWYENKIPYTTSNDSQAFTFNTSLSHRFSERYQLSVHDAFVIGQEPDLLRSGNTFATYQRISGDNIRNYGTIAFDAQLTPTFGANIGYDNSYYDYSAHGATTNGIGEVIASPSATLDDGLVYACLVVFCFLTAGIGGVSGS